MEAADSGARNCTISVTIASELYSGIGIACLVLRSAGCSGGGSGRKRSRGGG